MPRLLAFGEVLLRLSPPGRQLLLQSPGLEVWVGGAEANVVTQLAQLGHDAGLISAVPSNDLGEGVVAALRGRGVDVSRIQRHGDRLGLYFVTPGAGLRPTEVIYDRVGSSFAETPADAWDWDVLLEGADRLHLSGITPALGPGPAAAALAAVKAASARGIAISFDGNWRGKLWDRWDGEPRAILTRIVAHADLLFGNHRDVALLLDARFDGDGIQRRREAAEAAFAAFPKLQLIASTARVVEHADQHRLAVRIDARDRAAQTAELNLAGIVDRVGAGDAFAAGVLHALRSGGDIDQAAQTGLTVAALKHSLPGDAALFRQADIDAFTIRGSDIRR